MSMFDSDNFRWRETYFVLFDSARRPQMEAVQRALRGLSRRFEFRHLHTDADGAIDSLTLVSPADFAALDISYLAGDEIREQAAIMAAEVKSSAADDAERAKLARMKRYDARFDIMHFEQVSDDPQDDEEEMFDPSALLMVMEALTELTGGVGIDPQSGAILS